MIEIEADQPQGQIKMKKPWDGVMGQDPPWRTKEEFKRHLMYIMERETGTGLDHFFELMEDMEPHADAMWYILFNEFYEEVK